MFLNINFNEILKMFPKKLYCLVDILSKMNRDQSKKSRKIVFKCLQMQSCTVEFH